MYEKRYNLVDEKWIPVSDKGLASLRDVFSNHSLRSLGGNPAQKISVIKLLLAVAQSAWTPRDDNEWRQVSVAGMCDHVNKYLTKWHDSFWFYGDKPFLQICAIDKAEKKSFSCVMPEVAYGNTTILTQTQTERSLMEYEKVLILILQMSLSLGGKKTDNSVVLTPGYTGKMNDKGKPSTGKPGPGVAFYGLLHSFVFGATVAESIWFNLFSTDKLNTIGMYKEGLGVAPWEQMPKGEYDTIARSLQNSYMGRLIPLSRFMLFKENYLHYSEGILHKNYLEGIVDPSVAVNLTGKKATVIWTDVEKRPWRQLSSLLSFMNTSKGDFLCLQLDMAISRLTSKDNFSIWSGGIQVSSNAGEQYLSGSNDYVESEVHISGAIFNDASSFITTLNGEMEKMDNISRALWGRVNRYNNDLKIDNKEIANQATGMYWQLCERIFQQLVDVCGQNAKEVENFTKKYLQFAYEAYDRYCPNQTSRQLEAWAANRFGFEKKKDEDKKSKGKEAVN